MHVFATDDAQSSRWPDFRHLAWKAGTMLDYKAKSYRPGHFVDRENYIQPKTYMVKIDLPANVRTKLCSIVVDGQRHPPVLCQDARATIPARPKGAAVSVFLLPEGHLIGASQISVTDMLVVGLGDSFASGEGNPDRPATWQTSRLAARYRGDKGWIRHNQPVNDADWLDEQCHRSLYSYQNLTAMWLAAQDPHRAVTFVHLACSGAEIKDGLLEKQTAPPGGGDHVSMPQLRRLNEVLCTKGQQIGALPCERTRQIDLLLLSVGGNDVGFGHIINHYLLPRAKKPLGAFYRALIKAGLSTKTATQANTLITTRLGGSYQELAKELHKWTRPNRPRSVLLTAYPDPLVREDGQHCALAPGRDFMFEGLRHCFWQATVLENFRFGEDAQARIESQVILPLRTTQKKAASDNHWTLVDGFVGPLKNHGMCAVADPKHSEAELGWPYPGAAGRWAVVDPSQWRPYKPRARWFRTAHDSMLTQRARAAHVELHGSFHPAARAHAAMAEAVIEAAGAGANGSVRR